MKILQNIQKAAAIEVDAKYLNITPKLRINNSYLFYMVLIFSICLFYAHVSVFLDDVFIYLRVAKNIANGTGPVLNPGDNHFPVTSPLWVFLLALLHKVFAIIDLMVLSKILFIVSLGFASWLGFVCLRSYIGSWAILIPLPLFFNYVTLTTVGGEIALVYLSLFGTLWAYYIKKNYMLTGFWAAIAYLARGELVLLLVPIMIHYLFQWRKEKKSIRATVSNFGKITAVFLVVISIWHIYYVIQFQAIFPNTLNTKIIQGKSGMWPLYYRLARIHAWGILGKKYYLAIFLLFGLVYFRALSLSLLCFTVCHYYVYKYLTIPYYHWYFYDFYLFIPLFTVLGMIAFFIFLGKFFRLYNDGSREFRQFPGFIKRAAVLLLFCAAVFCIFSTTKIKNLSGYNYKDEDRFPKYLKVVNWTKQRLKKGDVFLSPEIGIVGYFLGDCHIRDFNGIASPGVTVDNINNLNYFVGTYSPRFIFFPWGSRNNPMEYILVKDKIYIYKKGYEVKINGQCRESVFIYNHRMPAPAFIYTLNQLKLNARQPGVELTQIKGEFILDIPLSSTFRSGLKVPEYAAGVSLQLGFLPGFLKDNQEKCKVVLRVNGIKEKQKILLCREVLDTFSKQGGQQIYIPFPADYPGFDSLQIEVKVKHPKDSRETRHIAIYNLKFQEEQYLSKRHRPHF